MLEAKKHWIDFEEMKISHSEHPSVIECRRCKRRYCEHMKDSVCLSSDVCVDCDPVSQPSPYNHLNRDVVIFYGIELK